MKSSRAILAGLSCVLFISITAQAQNKRTAYVQILNQTNQPIYNVTVMHKYSDVFKDQYTWKQVNPGSKSQGNMTARFNTGAFTTGKDWWIVTWTVANDKNSVMQYTTNPNNFRDVIDVMERGAKVGIPIATTALGVASVGVGPVAGLAIAGGSIIANELAARTMNNESTAGFKQHILRGEDAKQVTQIRIKPNGTVVFRSKSGKSETVSKRKVVRFNVPQQQTQNNNSNNSGQAANGYTVRSVKAGNNGRHATTFQMVGNKQWQEVSATNSNSRFNFAERNRDQWSVYLYDRSRNVHIQLDLYTKEVKYAAGNAKKSPIYKIISSSTR